MVSLRWLGGVAVAAAMVTGMATRADAVPSYVRQTGFSCNQCHASWAPFPDFTMTGQKFRMNAYRDPFTAEKLEAGQEGAINGKRMVLGLQNAWTWHYRSSLLQQSRAPYNPALPKPAASSISTNQFSSVGMDYAGPIGEHFGIWTEYYVDAAGAVGNVRGDFTNAEYTVAFATNPGGPGNIIGVVWTNQELPNDVGFSPFRSTAPSHWFSNLPRSGRIQPNSRISTYGFLGDRFLYNIGIMAGMDNTDYKTLSYAGSLGYAIGNTDDNQMWLVAHWMAGNDVMPLMTSQVYVNSSPSPAYQKVETVAGSSVYTSNGQPYGSANIGDTFRIEPEFRFGFIDRGAHSLQMATSYVFEQDKYADGAQVTNAGWGTSWRYLYDRTLGLNVNVNKRTKFEFVDRFGAVHNVPSGMGFGIGPYYRVAMNAALELSYTKTQTDVLDAKYNSGWAWNLSWHFLF